MRARRAGQRPIGVMDHFKAVPYKHPSGDPGWMKAQHDPGMFNWPFEWRYYTSRTHRQGGVYDLA